MPSLSTPSYYLLPHGHHLNNGKVTAVFLTRDSPRSGVIPYETICAVTLIAILRLGLMKPLKERAYNLFVNLPLYEDMAPWNIVFQGDSLDYIDYDTRDKTYDMYVEKVYQILSVLMNYKRTVTDFEKCGLKGGNPYGFSHVSECIKSTKFSGPCEEPEKPVACGDGQCHSDYISCLRATVEADFSSIPSSGISSVSSSRRQDADYATSAQSMPVAKIEPSDYFVMDLK